MLSGPVNVQRRAVKLQRRSKEHGMLARHKKCKGLLSWESKGTFAMANTPPQEIVPYLL